MTLAKFSLTPHVNDSENKQNACRLTSLVDLLADECIEVDPTCLTSQTLFVRMVYDGLNGFPLLIEMHSGSQTIITLIGQFCLHEGKSDLHNSYSPPELIR